MISIRIVGPHNIMLLLDHEVQNLSLDGFLKTLLNDKRSNLLNERNSICTKPVLIVPTF